MRTIAAAVVSVAAIGCTTVQVAPVDRAAHPIGSVCIERNERVAVAGFLSIVEDGFSRHGIRTRTYSTGLVPDDCRYVLTYTARRGWDFVPFLKTAELRLRRDGLTVGSASYRHRGGLGLTKYASTRSKVEPLVRELLSGPLH